MNNIRKFILLGILLVISIGAVSASDISDDCQQTAAQLDNQDSTIESNPIVGQSVHIENADKNLKEASNKEIIVSQKRGDDISGSGTSDKPYKTINKAINSASSNDKIIISDDKYTLTAIDEGKVIYNNITITSNGKTILTNVNNVAGDKHIFQIGSGFTVLFSNLIFENVKDKSIITNHGSVTIKNCTFKNSKVSLNTDEYKAIVNNYQKMTVDGCSFTNINGNYGSALFNRGTLTVYNTNFTGNTASKNGGAIYNELNNITITNCILNNNEAKKSLQNTQPVGGAIYNNGNLAIRNSTLSNNEASTGGAVYNNKQLNAINSTFRQNNADCAGAIINLQRATINGCEFNNNYAEGHGIVILNIANYNNQKNQPQLALSNSLITNNNYIEDSMIANSYIATITDCLITNNSCGEGMIFNNATLKITGTKTYNNEVLGWGGIIQNEGNLTATNNLFMNTTGAFNGGVICIYHGDTSIISTNVFDSNEANEFDGMGGCISVKDSKNTTIRLNTFKNNRAFEGGAIYSDTTSIDICYNKFINNRAEYVGSAISNYGDNFKIRYNNFTANVVSNDGTNLNNYGSKVTVTGNVNYNGKKYPSTVENVGDKGQIIYNRFEDTIKAVTTTTTVSALSGVVGDRITLTATVKDNTGTAVEGGRVIFKLNGVTLKDNGKLSGSSNPLKVYVSNGIATTTIIADLSMKSISQISASYIGTTLYEKSNSNTAKAQIKLRSARIVVTSNVKTIKQGQTLTITATVYDTTNGKDSTNLVKYSDEFVYFKVNGITLKDSKGNMLKAKIVNGVATVNYTVPLGLSGVTDGKTMTPKNHTILAGFYNKNYNEDIRNTSYFQVERSNITIAIANATVNNKTHTLSLTATIRDYLGNIVAGPNKCVIKINGVSLKNGTEAMYYYSTNGVLKINNIKIPAYNKYTSIEIVTQDRLAYKNQRNTTSTIRVVN